MTGQFRSPIRTLLAEGDVVEKPEPLMYRYAPPSMEPSRYSLLLLLGTVEMLYIVKAGL